MPIRGIEPAEEIVNLEFKFKPSDRQANGRTDGQTIARLSRFSRPAKLVIAHSPGIFAYGG